MNFSAGGDHDHEGMEIAPAAPNTTQEVIPDDAQASGSRGVHAPSLQAGGAVSNDRPGGDPRIHEARASAPAPGVGALLRTPAFLRLWSAQIVSNLGDWAYALSVAAILASRLNGAGLVRSAAILYGVQGLASAVV